MKNLKIILSKSDHPRHKKWRYVDLQDGGSQPSCILGIQQWVLWKEQLQLRSRPVHEVPVESGEFNVMKNSWSL